jgi:hypothetical protein
MEPHPRLSTADVLELLELPRDGRVLAFGPRTALFGLEIAATRPDALVVVCDTEYETTTQVADRAGAEQLNNLIIGDTPAGPLVDRCVCVDTLGTIDPQHLVTILGAMLPGGYAIFIEPETTAAKGLIEKLLSFGFTIADELQGAIAGSTAIRAR